VGPGHRRGTGFAGPRPGEVTCGAWLLNGGESRVGDEDPRAPTAKASCTAMAYDPASPAGQRGPSAGLAAGQSPGPPPPPPPAGNGPVPRRRSRYPLLYRDPGHRPEASQPAAGGGRFSTLGQSGSSACGPMCAQSRASRLKA
jgi:hypothetical protein